MAEEITSSYDYSMIGSMGGEAAQSVNGDMINKIRAAEEKATLDPIQEDIDNLTLETEKIEEIKTKVKEFQDIVNYFDIYNDENVFNQHLFDTSGTAAVFDATNMSNLKEGSTEVTITQLAKRDVYQSDTVHEDNIDDTYGAFSLDLTIGGVAADPIDIDGLTLEEIASQVDLLEGVNASVEKVSDTDYRLVIKASEPGTDNAVVIGGTAAAELGYDDVANHTLSAKNLKATIDGIEYDVSADSITTQGSLKITGIELGTSTITVSKDTSAVTVAAEAMVTQYNSLMDMLNEEIYDTESVIEDTDTLKTIQTEIKNLLFQSYGAASPEHGSETDEYGDKVYAHSNVTNNDKNIFMFGFEVDQYGILKLDTDTFNDIINGDDENYTFDDLKNVFTGAYENKGLGVQMKEYLDGLDGYEGLISEYEDELIEREEDLKEEKEDEIERLDAKYGIMAEQFSQYSALIAQMEASFSGLKMMIEQSVSSN